MTPWFPSFIPPEHSTNRTRLRFVFGTIFVQAWYLTTTSFKRLPWYGAYTNGASLKHAGRLRALGPMLQKECFSKGNCELEFINKAAYAGSHAARLCWRGDLCEVTWDNEPQERVLFMHQGGRRSPGHDDNLLSHDQPHSHLLAWAGDTAPPHKRTT